MSVNSVNIRDNLPLVHAKVKNHDLVGLVDTGSSISCLSAKFVHLCSKMNRLDTQKIRVFNGEIFESKGIGCVNLNFGELNLNVKDAVIIQDLRYDFIIGMSDIKSLSLQRRSNEVSIILNGHEA